MHVDGREDQEYVGGFFFFKATDLPTWQSNHIQHHSANVRTYVKVTFCRAVVQIELFASSVQK